MQQQKDEIRITADKVREPFYFIREVLGVERLTPEQIEIVKSVFANKYTDVRACHTVGKTFIEAVILLTFMFTIADSVVVTTAPTGRQVKDLLWREVNKLYENAKYNLGGKCNAMGLEIEPKWFATGVATQPGNETESATKIQGYHAPNILIIVDEAYGIHKTIFEAIDGIASSAGARWLAVGNPSSLTSAYSLLLKSEHRKPLTISAFSHPNVVEEREVIPGAVSHLWVQAKIRDWCEVVTERINKDVFEYKGKLYNPNDLFRWKVLGVPPLAAIDSLISFDQVWKAMNRFNTSIVDKYNHLSLDVARFGSDESVFCHNKNNHFTFISYYHFDVAQITGESLKKIKEYGPTVMSIDCDGVGGGVYDNLNERKHEGTLDLGLVQIHSGSSPIFLGQTEEFLNLRAQMYWQLRQDIDEISLQKDEELAEGLSSIRYFFNSRGKIQIESKDDFKERMGRSPDKEDSLAYCNFIKYLRTVNPAIQQRDLEYYQRSGMESVI